MPPGGMGLERFLQSSLSFTDFEDSEFPSVPHIHSQLVIYMHALKVETNREREESFVVPLEGEEEALMESERGSEESLEMNKDIALAARRER